MKKKTTKEILEAFLEKKDLHSGDCQKHLDEFSRSWRETLKKRLKTCRRDSTRREILDARIKSYSMREILLDRETSVSDALMLTYPEHVNLFANWLLKQKPQPSLWSGVPQDWKFLLVEHVFEREDFPEFAIYDASRRMEQALWMSGRRRWSVPPSIVPSYLPSRGVKRLRYLIKLAEDAPSLSLVDTEIKERKSLKFKTFEYQYSINLDHKGKELLAPLFRAINGAGFSVLPLPPIGSSYADPPLFLRYPHHEGEERIPDDDIFNIEELLGLYLSHKERIVLFEKGIAFCARRLKEDQQALRWVVLVHELGHWLSHVLPQKNPPVPRWSLDTYTTTSTEVHEGLAQFFCHWLVQHHRSQHPNYAKIFDNLNKKQSGPYHVYKELVNKGYTIDQVLQSIAALRQLDEAADKNTWFSLLSSENSGLFPSK
jgi:hypothetical protein